MNTVFTSRNLTTVMAVMTLMMSPAFVNASFATETKSYPSSDHAANLSETFRPQPRLSVTLDFDYFDYILDSVIFYLGPSDRVRRVNRNTFNNGKRGDLVGHKSVYRMEGSRIYLKRLPAGFDEDMRNYRQSLQVLAKSVPITHLSRDEQLAFWFNLHNSALMEQLSKKRRLRYTTEKKFGPEGETLHDFKFIEIEGYKLSLRDIREKIVYRHWRNPVVIYGFFLGDLGGPSLQPTAFTGTNVQSILRKNANEFVNALRGFELHKNRNQVSRIYVDTQKYFFPHFHGELKQHFKEYMRPEVFELVKNVSEFSIAPYEYRVASISGGRASSHIRGGSVASSYDPDTGKTYSTPEDIARSNDALGYLIRDYAEKRDRLRDMGLLKSDVIIEDIETEDNIPYPKKSR